VEILDETDDWIVVDKPAPLLVYRSKPAQTESLLDQLQDLLVYEIANGGQISVVTRLDRETSGVCLFAKHAEAARLLGKAMQAHQFRKTYRALCWGWPEAEAWIEEGRLRREGEIREGVAVYVKQCVDPEGGGNEARTDFTVIEKFEAETSNGRRFSLVEAAPTTGRTHQIRVHLAHAGFPIVGDKLYGLPGETGYLRHIEEGWTTALAKELLLPRQALHATRLEWPERGLCWEAPWPAELQLAGVPGA